MKIQHIHIDKNVLEAAKERISFIFDNYPNIICSVSGGKDSTVLCHLVMTEAVKRNRKVGIFFLDTEALYNAIIDQVKYLLSLYPELTIPYWLQVEVNMTQATSLSSPRFKAWDKDKKHLWLREKDKLAIHTAMWDKNKVREISKFVGFGFLELIDAFSNNFTDTAFFVGLRAAESLNRWRATTKFPLQIADKSIYWATMKGVNIATYPLYDWSHSDIWKYIYDNNVKYCKIYDYMYLKGLNERDLRIGTLVHQHAFKSLVDLPEFEPDTYNKLVKRTGGIAFAQEWGRNKKAMLVQKLPMAFKTWLDYRNFLLEIYPDRNIVKMYIERFGKQAENEFVYRQQAKQLILNDARNRLPVNNTNIQNTNNIIKKYENLL